MGPTAKGSWSSARRWGPGRGWGDACEWRLAQSGQASLLTRLKWESEKKVTSSVPTPGAIIYMWLRSRERSHIIPAHSRTSPGVSTGDPEGGRCVGGIRAGVGAATGRRCEVVVVKGGQAWCTERAGVPAVHRKEKG